MPVPSSTATATGFAPSTTTSRGPRRSRPAHFWRRWPLPVGGCGIGEQLVEEDLAEQEARSRFFLIDRPGPLHDGLAAACPPEELERLVDSKMWQQRYLMVTLKRSGV